MSKLGNGLAVPRPLRCEGIQPTALRFAKSAETQSDRPHLYTRPTLTRPTLTRPTLTLGASDDPFRSYVYPSLLKFLDILHLLLDHSNS